MKEHPILMSTPNAQAILQGRKTMTRRIIKPQPIDNREIDGNFFHGNHKGYVKVDGHPNWQKQFVYEFSNKQVGDLLWVRESGWVDNNYIPGLNDPHLYWKADYDNYSEHTKYLIENHTCKFPAIHMYKVFACIWLEITAIRIERLQDISEDDAIKEGVEPTIESEFQGMKEQFYKNYGNLYSDDQTDAIESFCALWHLLNGKESWDANPWVWVIEFKRIEK